MATQVSAHPDKESSDISRHHKSYPSLLFCISLVWQRLLELGVLEGEERVAALAALIIETCPTFSFISSIKSPRIIEADAGFVSFPLSVDI